MPEYYFDEDIDNNRLDAPYSCVLSTKKELCQEIYEKPFMTVPTEITSKKEFGGGMFGQDTQGVPSEYPRMLMPLGDMPTTSMASLHDMSMYQRALRPPPIAATEVRTEAQTRPPKSAFVPTGDPPAPLGASATYRVTMRDASTSTASPMNVELSSVTAEILPKQAPNPLTLEMKPEEDVMGCDEPTSISNPPRPMPDSGVNLLVVAPKQPPRSHPEKVEMPMVLKSAPRSLPQVPTSCSHACTAAASAECSAVGEHREAHEDAKPSTQPDVAAPTEDGDCEAACGGAKSRLGDAELEEKAPAHKCGHCSELFKARRALVRHMRVHPVDKAFPCDHCGKLFSRNSALINHKRTHSKDKAYMCDQCGLTMPTRNDLSSHELTHVGVRPFVCQDCGKSFKKAGALSTHRKLHTGDTPFVCEFCGKAFTSNGNLENHLRVHSGDKPYSCDYCGKAFNTTANLNRHVRIHTGEKPYVCDWCNKAFSQSYALVIHKRIHTGEQPYFCKQCGKTFSDNSTLYKHKRIHKDATLDEVLPVPPKMANRKPPANLEMPLTMPGGSGANGQPPCVMPCPVSGVSSCGPMPLGVGSGVMTVPSVTAALSMNPLMRINPASVAAMMPAGPILPGAATAAHVASRMTAPFMAPRPMIDSSTAAMDVHNMASRGVLTHPTSSDASTMVVS